LILIIQRSSHIGVGKSCDVNYLLTYLLIISNTKKYKSMTGNFFFISICILLSLPIHRKQCNDPSQTARRSQFSVLWREDATATRLVSPRPYHNMRALSSTIWLNYNNYIISAQWKFRYRTAARRVFHCIVGQYILRTYIQPRRVRRLWIVK